MAPTRCGKSLTSKCNSLAALFLVDEEGVKCSFSHVKITSARKSHQHVNRLVIECHSNTSTIELQDLNLKKCMKKGKTWLVCRVAGYSTKVARLF